MATKLLKRKNYLRMLENAAEGENRMFRNLYAKVDETEKDLLNDGQLSCAVFASSVLLLNGLIKGLHATVGATVKDLLSSGWAETDEPEPGDVVVWEKKDFGSGGVHSHIGFYLGEDIAVSNSSFDGGIPQKHHYTYNGMRKIEKILHYPGLSD